MFRFAALALILSTVCAFSQGTGLTGQYYDTASFGTLKTTRVDATVNFNFGTAIPSGTTITNADTFSVAWSGQIVPEILGLYTFYVTADDGARLWVNDQMVVCRTFAAVGPEMGGQVSLVAGQEEPITERAIWIGFHPVANTLRIASQKWTPLFPRRPFSDIK